MTWYDFSQELHTTHSNSSKVDLYKFAFLQEKQFHPLFFASISVFIYTFLHNIVALITALIKSGWLFPFLFFSWFQLQYFLICFAGLIMLFFSFGGFLFLSNVFFFFTFSLLGSFLFYFPHLLFLTFFFYPILFYLFSK